MTAILNQFELQGSQKGSKSKSDLVRRISCFLVREVHVGSFFISATLVREGTESECAATLRNGRFRIGCFLIGCSVPRLRCGGITKLWFEVSVASLALGSEAMSWVP